MSQGETARESLARIEEEQAGLRAALSGWDASVLAIRPPNGHWSVLEHVRHLLFAEQLHLGPFGAKPVVWSPFGFTPETMRRQRKLPPLEEDPSAFSVPEVLAAWQAVHAELRGSLQEDTPQLRDRLARHLRHLRAHIDVIKKLLRQRAKAT
jgi:hypothetical protein